MHARRYCRPLLTAVALVAGCGAASVRPAARETNATYARTTVSTAIWGNPEPWNGGLPVGGGYGPLGPGWDFGGRWLAPPRLRDERLGPARGGGPHEPLWLDTER